MPPETTEIERSTSHVTPRATGGPQVVIRKILHRFGIDRAIAYTLAGRGWSVLSGPVTLFFIARFLKPAEQGFYYTFGSVIALNIFFELGLTFVILQFASHEKAHLEWNEFGTLSGSPVAHTRLAALLKLALKWYSIAASLVLLVVLPAGLVFFAKNSGASAVSWRAAWIWLVIASALDLLISPLQAIIEGSGKVSQLASMRIGQSVLSSLGLWLTLISHGGLFASPVVETVNVGVALAWIIIGYRRFFQVLLRSDVSGSPLNWGKEVWPFQWRIALSWLSGYFIFQIFNPVLFATRGPVVAGQMGMSITLCNALLGVSIAWMSTKASPFGVLVARREWHELDVIFFRTLRQSILVLVTGGLAIFGAIVYLNYNHHPFSQRIVSPSVFLMILIATMMNHIVFCEAQYLRTHKEEPFLWTSLTLAVLTAACTFLLAKPFGATGVAAGYLGCCSFGLVAGTQIFFAKRRVWHA